MSLKKFRISKIEKLESEQDGLISVYQEKWKQIGLSTERLDYERTVTAIKLA